MLTVYGQHCERECDEMFQHIKELKKEIWFMRFFLAAALIAIFILASRP